MKINLVPVLLLFGIGTLVSAQTGRIETIKDPPDHPRILLRQGEETLIRERISSHKAWHNIHQTILSESEQMITLPPVERIQIGRRLLDKSRECLRRVFYLSYAWRMTQEKKYLQRAERELLAVSAFSDWNPSHFLDVAEMTMAVAIGYDWLYSALPEASRAVIREAILKKGIEPSLDSRHNGWLKSPHNWNQVCNAGMTYGALAIFEDQPELARRIIDRAIDSIVLSMEDYNPDGAYPEGYGYWGYGTSFNVLFLNALEKAFGSDLSLSQKSGFLKTAGYLENMTGPTGSCFNYSDSGTGSDLQPAMFWFAGRLKDPSLLWLEKGHLEKYEGNTHRSNRLLPVVLIWSKEIDLSRIQEPQAKMWVGKGKSPVALMRTSWSDPDAIFVGIKGGSPSVNHAHMDIGSFVMDAQGVRWAMDFGSDNYHNLESNGVDLWGRRQNSGRWKVFRYNNFVHNTLTVDNTWQRVDGYAPITGFSDQPSFRHAVVDMSAVYQGLLARVNRGIGIVDNRYVVVRDEMETVAKSTESVVRWTLLTSAEVKVMGPGSAELTQQGQKLRIEVKEPSHVSLRTWPTTPPHSYENPNKGTVLLGFEVRLPGKVKKDFTVLLIPSGVEKATIRKVRPL